MEKRRVARAFNALITGKGPSTRDGRTEKRRLRLLQELREGTARGKRELSPIDILSRVQALLDLGEPIASIRKSCPVRHKVEPSTDLVGALRRMHASYGFSAAAYAFVGVDDASLEAAGIAKRPGLARAPSVGRRGRGAA